MPKAAPKAIRRRRQRGSINAEEIISGAFEVARRESLDQLSMPALAEHLGVGVTSIYWYFRKKDDLLNAMTDVAVDTYIRKMPSLPDDLPWQEVLYNQYHDSREVHRNDPILSDLLLIRTATYTRYATRRVFEIEEALIGKLVDAGFTTENAFMALNAASIYLRGMIIHDRILRLSDAPTLDDRQRRIADWSALPLLESQIDRHPLAGTTDEDFAFGMARLISGFEALLREQDINASGRRPAAKRVTAAKPAASSGERAASRRATEPRSGAAAKPAARSAAASNAPGSQNAGGRTRTRQAS
ncbi:MAG TPA: TetR family transcriptional regulator [Streptosporangiaceae bacterium]|nr:TetR family transcriptional regulator [Streptosporangiaceae bacterium]